MTRCPFGQTACAKAGRRMLTRVYPDPISLGHLLSRDGHDIGWKPIPPVVWLRRSYAANLPSRHTSPALAKKRWARGPLRTTCSRRPPAVAPPLQAGGSADRVGISAIHSRGSHSPARLGWESPGCACAPIWNRIARTIRSPGAEGRLTRLSAKSDEIGCTRGAFHRSAAFVHDTALAPRVAFSTGAHLRGRRSRPELALASPPGQGAIHSFSPACGERTMPFSNLE
jgi:hypothetical protein